MHLGLRHLMVLGLVTLAGTTRAQAPKPPAPPADTRADYIRSHYTKYEYRIPMRDGSEAVHRRLRPQGREPAKRYPILLTRTPYSVAPYGVDRYRRPARARRAVREGGLHLRLPGRARPVDVRGRVRQHAAAQRRASAARRTSTRAPTPTTPSTGCVKNVPNNNGTRRPVGHLVPRLLHRRRA